MNDEDDEWDINNRDASSQWKEIRNICFCFLNLGLKFGPKIAID